MPPALLPLPAHGAHKGARALPPLAAVVAAAVPPAAAGHIVSRAEEVPQVLCRAVRPAGAVTVPQPALRGCRVAGAAFGGGVVAAAAMYGAWWRWGGPPWWSQGAKARQFAASGSLQQQAGWAGWAGWAGGRACRHAGRRGGGEAGRGRHQQHPNILRTWVLPPCRRHVPRPPRCRPAAPGSGNCRSGCRLETGQTAAGCGVPQREKTELRWRVTQSVHIAVLIHLDCRRCSKGLWVGVGWGVGGWVGWCVCVCGGGGGGDHQVQQAPPDAPARRQPRPPACAFRAS